jgi:hypothetical protein
LAVLDAMTNLSFDESVVQSVGERLFSLSDVGLEDILPIMRSCGVSIRDCFRVRELLAVEGVAAAPSTAVVRAAAPLPAAAPAAAPFVAARRPSVRSLTSLSGLGTTVTAPNNVRHLLDALRDMVSLAGNAASTAAGAARSEVAEDSESAAAVGVASVEEALALCTEVATIGQFPPDVVQASVKELVETMHRHADVPDVQTMGCQAVEALASLCVENQDAIVAAGGLPAVFRAMQRHGSSAVVQEASLRALFWIAASNHASQRLLVSSGAVQFVLAAMAQHVHTSAVQQYGCGTIGALADDADSRVDVATEEVLAAVLEVRSPVLQVQGGCT